MTVRAMVQRVLATPRRRVARALRQRVDQVQERERAATAPRHTHHFLLRLPGAGRPPRLVRHWPRRSIGGYEYHLRPGTRVTVAGPIVLIGQPVDIDGSCTDAAQIALRLARAWQAHRSTAPGPDEAVPALVAEAAGLGGRFALVLHHDPHSAQPAPVTVLTDALASVPIYTGTGSTGAVTSARRLLSSTPVLDLPADHWLRLAPDGTGRAQVSLQRHWHPAPHPDAADLEALFRAFRARFCAHVRLLSTLGPPVLSLTAGLKSRATLAALLQDPHPDALAFTTYDPQSARTSQSPAIDLFAASDLAHRVGLPHRVLPPHEPVGPHLVPGAVELRSTALGAGETSRLPVPNEAHPVLLPFCDRRILEMLWSPTTVADTDRELLRRLVAELP